MRRNDFREQAEDLVSEYGAQYIIDGDDITWWFEANKKTKTKLPPHSIGDYRGLKNSAAKWRKDLEAARPTHFVLQNQSDTEKDKWEAYLDKRLGDVKSDFEAKFEAMKSDVAASTDISLETGSKLDKLMEFFQGAFAGAGAAQKTLTVAPSEPPKTVEPPKLAIAPTLLKPAPKEPPKGFDVLEQVRAKQWANALETINTEFEIYDLEGRVLYFLHECGPCTPHELVLSGAWRSSDSVTRFLEEMEARPVKFVRLLKAEKKWSITKEGILALAEEPLDELEADQPIRVADTTDVVTQAKPPTLRIVPTARRILEQVANASRVMPPNLSVKTKLLIYLYWNECDSIPPKTTVELNSVVPSLRGYGPEGKDIGTLASMAKTTGHLIQKHRGAPWLLTPLGRDQARRKLGELGHNELQRKLGK